MWRNYSYRLPHCVCNVDVWMGKCSPLKTYSFIARLTSTYLNCCLPYADYLLCFLGTCEEKKIFVFRAKIETERGSGNWKRENLISALFKSVSWKMTCDATIFLGIYGWVCMFVSCGVQYVSFPKLPYNFLRYQHRLSRNNFISVSVYL